MKPLRNEFLAAANDYAYFLNRNYPQKALIKLIGDRYQLTGIERSMLFRGIWAFEEVSLRKQKLALPETILSEWIAIDAYNVLITIGSYLNGNLVFISNDHLLRDASEIHGKVFRTELLQRALNLTFEYLVSLKPSGIKVFIDSPVSHSGKLCSQINQMIVEYKIHGSAETHPSPDYLLKNIEQGIIATSDSTIIDKTSLPVFDLPLHVLQYHFQPDFIDLREIVNY